MRDFVNPRDTQPSVTEAFRQIRLILKELDVPLLKDKRSLRGIAEGTSAYYLEGTELYRYTKVNGNLYKEKVDIPPEVDIPELEAGNRFTEPLEPFAAPLSAVYYEPLDPFPFPPLEPFEAPLRPFAEPLSPVGELDALDGVWVVELLEGVAQQVRDRLLALIMLTVDAASVLSAIEAMTDEQKAMVIEALGVMKEVVMRTAEEIRDLLLGLSRPWLPADAIRDLSVTVDAASVLAAIQAMTTQQKEDVRDALGGVIADPPTALTFSTRFGLPTRNDDPTYAYYNKFDSAPIGILEENGNVFFYRDTLSYSYVSDAELRNHRGVDYNSKVVQVWSIHPTDNKFVRHDVKTLGEISGTVLNAANAHPRGMAHVIHIDQLWVVDYIDRLLYRYGDADGNFIAGTYPLHANNGSAVDITYIPDIREIWVLDQIDRLIYRYNATGDYLGTFTLHTANTNPRGLVYVPSTHKVWVTNDGSRGEAFVYDVAA